jgi:hypothetical protein
MGMYAENKTSEDQYRALDGNLSACLNKLRTKRDQRKNLRRRDLMEKWTKQDGRCAITGIEMTYRAKEGEFYPYNVSPDRIVPGVGGGEYISDNVQLVCKIVNDIKKHYRGSDVKDAIMEFASKVIKAHSASRTSHCTVGDVGGGGSEFCKFEPILCGMPTQGSPITIDN